VAQPVRRRALGREPDARGSLALEGEARARARYLLALLAKHLAQHAHRVLGAAEARESTLRMIMDIRIHNP